MRPLTLRGLASAAVAAGLVSGGTLPAVATTRSAQAGIGAATAPASRVTTTGNLHGFRLTYQQANPDGSVTALLRRGRTTVVYLGGAGSRLSLSVAARIVTASVNGKTKRLVRQGVQVGATNPVAKPGMASPGFGPAGLAAASSVRTDLNGTGLAGPTVQLLAAQDAAMAKTTIARGHLATPAATSGGNKGHISSWCVATVDTDYEQFGPADVVANGCDVRTVLQNQSGDNFIADDMSAQASCKSQCSDLLSFNIHLAYSFPADNKVLKEAPNTAKSTGCNDQISASVTWFGIPLAWTETPCDGVITPKGLGSANGVGAYWQSNCKAGECGVTNDKLGIEEIAQDNATANTNPDTTLYVYVVYDNYGATGNGLGQCKNSCPG